MKRTVIRGAVLAAALVTAGLVVPAAAPAQVITATGWCSPDVPAPCITGAQVKHADGSTETVQAESATWEVSALAVDPADNDGATQLLWDVTRVDGSALDPTDTWTVSFRFDSVVPRATYTHGRDVGVTRIPFSAQRPVSITGHPARSGLDNCDTSRSPWTCSATAKDDRFVFSGDVSDFGQWEDPTQRNHLYGYDVWTNVEATDAPPQVFGSGTADSPVRLLVTMANTYKWSSGAVATPAYHMRLPKAFLKDMGVDNPDTMDASAIAASIPAATTTVDTSGGDIVVDVSGIKFPDPAAAKSAHATARSAPRVSSQRTLSVRRGNVLPGRPYSLHGSRKTRTTAAVAFHAATPHGSAVTGYQARCTATHRTTRFGSAAGTRVVIGSLTAGVAYRCGVRAHARAGWGPWSLHTVFMTKQP